ncbi:carcinoembryonic antigen-related cell adhesion molecule 6-like isoform X3 [Bos javanicus]|uniref:carcinoembryonic antigen-related cell adhesion molecule 6-like isoform X3 n=1 Tax=Bos javanicus TaxID=9906 RepID=UPI002AA71954|nr:carcinoembryonic antigen-related cell adhesion molecule 6-like isoform X3 [Bos javanicus]
MDISACEHLLTERGTQQTAGTMGTPSGPPRRRCIPWNGLLLAVSLLTFWTLPTTAQPTIETMPPLAAEGSDVLLLAHNVAKNPLGYAWYRGERVDNSQLIASYRVDTNATTKGPAHSGRETLYPNGTLLIQSVTQEDTGSYTLLVTNDDLRTERPTGHLHVHPVLPTPVITSNNSNPWEHKDTVVLTCGPETQNTSYTWWISNQSLPKSTRLELSEDKRTLTVFSVTRKEKGPYVCETRNLVSISRSDPFTLDVLYPVARPSLQVSNTTVPEHEGPVVLTCLTDETGVSIRWLFKGQSLLLADRMTLSSDSSTLTIDPVSREDAGAYQCEVSNRGNSSRSGPLRLRVTWRENAQALGVGAITGIVIGVLLVLTLLAVLGCFIFLHRGNWPPASTSGGGPSGSSVSQASLPDARPPAPIYQSQCDLQAGSECNLLRYLRTTGRPWASSWVSVSQEQLPRKFGNPGICDCAERPQTKTQQRPTLGWVGQPNRCSGVSARLGERVTWWLLKQHF